MSSQSKAIREDNPTKELIRVRVQKSTASADVCMTRDDFKEKI